MSVTRKVRILIPPERADFVRDLAETLADEHQTVHGTDLKKILADYSIELFFDDFRESFDGLLIKDDQGYRVACNIKTGNTPGSHRSRFTIAHELGHYFIDEHRTVLTNRLMPSMGESAIQDNLMEREADLFASHLLLPTELIRKAFKKSDEGMSGIREVSSRFGTSMKCASIRYLGENILPCCLTFRGWDGSLRWKWFSRKLWLAGIRKVREEPVEKSATSQVLEKGPDAKAEIIDSAATARYIFQMGDGQNSNEVFREETMALGEYGALTLFSAQKKDLPLMADVLNRRFGREV